MELTDEEKTMLDGGRGPAVRKAMEILVALGEIYDAERMVRISSVHMPGASILATGPAGLNFIKDMARQVDRFATFTTLNPGAVDRIQWPNLALTEEDIEDQRQLTDAYERMGAISCHTCTPYTIGNVPRVGEHVAWGESSAVAYCNSVLGGRTNREGGPTALAAAITGRTPAYAYHLTGNRRGHYLIRVTVPLNGIYEYGSLGYYVGKIVEDKIPVFTGIPPTVTNDELKMLAAALASSGAVTLFHVVGVTPEASTMDAAFGGKSPEETIEVGASELAQVAEKLNTAPTRDVDWIYLGCPHLSIQEIDEVTRRLEGRRLKSGVSLWISSSQAIKAVAEAMGYSRIIESAGGMMICDTCPVLGLTDCIAPRNGYRTITTNSAKMAHYMPGQFNMLSHYGTLKQCLEAGISGHWE